MVKSSSGVATLFPKSVFCGGLINGDQILNEVIQFDGKNWASLPAMNVVRCGAVAVYWNGMKKVQNSYYVWAGFTLREAPGTFDSGKMKPPKPKRSSSDFHIFAAFFCQIR